MKLQEMNMLKRFFKRKLRITDAVLVSMIICGGASYSLDEIANDMNKVIEVGKIIKIEDKINKKDEELITMRETTNAVIFDTKQMEGFIKNEGSISAEIIITRDNITLTSSSVLNSAISLEKCSNGIYGNNINVENDGIIQGNVSLSGGEFNATTNNHDIVASITSVYSGNGILGGKNIQNTGIISGKTSIIGSNVKVTNPTNSTTLLNGIPSSKESGNGIFQSNQNQTLSLNNEGVIRGNANIKGGLLEDNASSTIDCNNSGNGVFQNNVDSSSNHTANLTLNNGIIRGEADLTGTSIFVSNTISKQTSAVVYSTLSGNGIIFIDQNDINNHNKNILNITKNDGIVAGKISAEASELTNTSGSSTLDPNHPGYSKTSITLSGNGIANNIIEFKENRGVVSGEAYAEGGKITISSNEYVNLFLGSISTSSGNGIYSNSNVNIENNKGIIKGNATTISGTANITTSTSTSASKDNTTYLSSSGNGIYNGNNVNNDGTISGYAYTDNNNSVIESGNGIFLSRNSNNKVDNKGVIKGSESAIATATDGIVNNYGVLAGANNYYGNITDTNYGIYIQLKNDSDGNISLDSNGNVEIEKISNSISGTIIDGKEVINATDSNDHSNKDDVYFKVENTGNYNNFIVNGVGIESGTLTVEKDVSLELKDSIINSYKTAVTLKDGANFTAKNTIFNGGGLQNEDSILETKGDNVKIEIAGNSVLNGKTTINGNDSTMTVSNQTQVNGDIISNGTGNYLGLGDEDTSGSNLLIIYNDISGFDKIDTKGSVMLSTEATIDTGTIVVKEGSKLIVDLDGTSRDSNDYVTGHALYTHTGEIILESPEKYTDDTGDLDDKSQIIFRASGLGEDTIIAMNGTEVSSINDYYLGTYSIAHTALKLNDADGNVILSVKNFDDIFPDVKPNPTPDPDIKPNPTPDSDIDISEDSNSKTTGGDIIEHRDDVKKIYEEIKNSGQIGILSPTTDTADKRTDAKSELMSILDQIYANNPYAFVGEASKEAIDLFLGSHQYVAIPEKGNYLVYGTAISSYSNYHDVEMNNVIDGKDSINKYGRDTTTVGGLGDIEYGLGNKASLGFLFGGANQKVDMSHNSELDGDILYLGLYHRKELGKYTFETGAGYQYASYDVTRKISNKYQTIKNEGDVESNSVVLYEDIRYLLKDENGWKIQPKLTFTLVHVEQESTHEKKSDFSMNIDDQSYDYFDTEIGVEVTKEIMLEKGKLRTKGYLGYINSQGSSEEKVSAEFAQGGEKVNLLGPGVNSNSGKVGIELTYEKLTGLEYSIGIDYKVGEKENNSTFGRIGIGYTF